MVGYVTDSSDLLYYIRHLKVDILLLDLHITGSCHEGLELMVEARRIAKGIKTIVFSNLESEEMIIDAIVYGGAINYITKDFYKDLPEAITNAAANISSIHHSVAGKILTKVHQFRQNDLYEKISPNQIEILKLLSQGCKRADIATQLHYSEQTINNEIYKITNLLKNNFPYVDWGQLKKRHTKIIISLAKKLGIISFFPLNVITNYLIISV
ncbi:response regulator [Paenibacillus sp. FSL H7-0326]|uniref:response regulator n=1 Tax=Paenibacillus sp. FSL H7-0326 TaxID=1921144 RepID=UPI002116FD94|nr:response regulator [Paenibacillus sp. FSL H7-0326]